MLRVLVDNRRARSFYDKLLIGLEVVEPTDSQGGLTSTADPYALPIGKTSPVVTASGVGSVDVRPRW